VGTFKFQFSYRVGVADINYGGHVANSALLNYFQDARIAYLAELGPYSEIDLGGLGLSCLRRMSSSVRKCFWQMS
jgi:acyl-CoA thioester hydrolase